MHGAFRKMNAFFSRPFKCAAIALVAVFLASSPAYHHNRQPSKINGNGEDLADSVFRTIDVGSVVPEDFISSSNVQRVKKWPYRRNSYVALIHFDIQPDDYSGYFLAMFEFGKDYRSPKLVARFDDPLPLTSHWDTVAEDWSARWLPDEKPYFLAFDFAPYKISDRETAFGLRFAEDGALPGGNRHYPDLLMLCRVKDTAFSNILSIPVTSVKNTEGEMRDDGTRPVEETEKECIVRMLQHKTNGYYDLMLKSSDGDWKKVFQWDKDAERYSPQGE
jgi:hypothetical protein